MTKPTYDPQMLTRLMWETKNIDDHAKLAQLFIDLDEQGDIEFTKKMRYEISSARHFFRFVREINDIAELCEFNLKLQELQEKNLALVTCLLSRRIAFQREIIIFKSGNF